MTRTFPYPPVPAKRPGTPPLPPAAAADAGRARPSGTRRGSGRPRPASRALSGAGLLVLVGGLGLAGCAAAPAPEPTRTVAPTPPPAPSPTTAPSALTCDELLPAPILDGALGSTFALDDGFVPEAGTPAAQLSAAGGAACLWTDGAGATVAVAAGEPGSTAVEAAQSEASRAGDRTDAFGSSVTAYVSGAGGATIDVFTSGGAWVHTTSTLYRAPADAQSIVEQVLQALPSG